MEYLILEGWKNGESRTLVAGSLKTAREFLVGGAQTYAGYASLDVRLQLQGATPSLQVFNKFTEDIEYYAVSLSEEAKVGYA
jgi:hypothetical protein